MSIPSGYKGKLHAWLNTKYNFISWREDFSHDMFVKSPDEDNFYLGSTDIVDVQFKDSRAEQIEALEKQIEKERAESQFRINQMLGKIQELQAIEARNDV